MGIEKNRVIDSEQIEKLIGKTQNLMTAADVAIDEIKGQLKNILTSLGKLPADVVDNSLKQQVETFQAKIETEEFTTYSQKIKKSLDGLKNKISSGDRKIGKEAAGLVVDLCGAVGKLKSLTDLIPKGADGGRYEEFKKEFDSMVKTWNDLEKASKSLKEKMVNAILGLENLGVCNSKDPVNLSTGNFIYEKEDMMTNGEPALQLTRSYNALDASKGSLGRGWRHSYEVSLNAGKEEIQVFLADGKIETFAVKKDGSLYSDTTRSRLIKRKKDTAIRLRKETAISLIQKETATVMKQSRGEA